MMTEQRPRAIEPETLPRDDLREFLLVVRRALLMVVSYIERKYML